MKVIKDFSKKIFEKIKNIVKRVSNIIKKNVEKAKSKKSGDRDVNIFLVPNDAAVKNNKVVTIVKRIIRFTAACLGFYIIGFYQGYATSLYKILAYLSQNGNIIIGGIK